MADRQQPTRPNPAPLRLFGHTLPAELIDAVAGSMQAPMLGEGWFVAGVVSGGVVAVLTYVLFGSVFFSGMAHSNPAAARAVLGGALLLGACYGLGGLVGSRWLRGPNPQPHRAVAVQRWLAAALLLLLGLSGLWHAWLFGPLTRVLGLVTFSLALGLGFRSLPALLAFAVGHKERQARAARSLYKLFLLATGLLSALVALPPIVGAEPGAFFLALTQLLGLLTLPWVAPMLAAARIHWLFAKSAN